MAEVIMNPGGSVLDPDWDKDVRYSDNILNMLIRNLGAAYPELAYVLRDFDRIPVRDEIRISTDGRALVYNPNRLVRTFTRGDVKELKTQLLHVIMHYLRGDIFYYRQSVHKDINDVILDAQVYKTLVTIGAISDMGSVPAETEEGYYAGKYDPEARKRILSYAERYASDDHSLWLNSEKWNKQQAKDASGSGGDKCDKERWEIHVKLVFGSRAPDMETFRKSFDQLFKQVALGNKACLDADICLEADFTADKSRTDYRSLIRGMLENIIEEKETEETIDRNMYCYGLEMYGDVPLIEPGEDECIKKEISRIAVAIDTSGSCYDRTACAFLGELGSMFREMAPYMNENSEVIVFECDSSIHKEDHYFLDDIGENTFKGRELLGGGGTSFVPVFDRIGELSRKDDDRPFKALIYLSDCEGEFPDKAPEYPVIFVVPSSYSEHVQVPDYVQLSFFDPGNI